MPLPSRDYIIHKWLRVPYTLHSRRHAATQKSQLTVVFIHGIGSDSREWQGLIQQLPANIRAISVDLLGFGQSPRPDWPTYDAKLQATSVIATLIKARLVGPVVIVGHSLGSLVAVEIAKRYTFLVRGLILGSPPCYDRTNPSFQEKLLAQLYTAALRNPQRTLTITKLYSKYPRVNSHFQVDQQNIDIFLATLEASIINQTTLDDITALHLPIHIISGRFDPLIPSKNLVRLSQTNPHITISSIRAAHDLNPTYIKTILNNLQPFTAK